MKLKYQRLFALNSNDADSLFIIEKLSNYSKSAVKL